MKILVCTKHVPDTAARIRVASDGVTLDDGGVKMIVSPYDEYAIEHALRLKDAEVAEEVVAVCAGPEAASATLRQAMAMGADRGILIRDERFGRSDGPDGLTRARVLAHVVAEESPGLCLLGRYGVGTDDWLTAAMLAEVLDLPHAANVSDFEVHGERFVARRSVEGGVETLEGVLPAVIACDKGRKEPRYPSLKGIMAAKKKPLRTLDASETGVELAGARVVWEALELPELRSACRFVEGAPEQAAQELARLLRDEAKVIG